MQRTRWIYLALIVALITIISVPLYLYNRPLGPSLELIPQPAVAADIASEPAKIVQPIVERQSSDNTCGGEGRVNILYLGQNLPETPKRGADSIRLMFVNYDAPSIAVLSMPPDLLAYLTDPPDPANTTLTYTFWDEIQPPPAGPPAAVRKATEVVAQALLDSYQFTTEKYMTMNQPVFGDCIDDLGGIEVLVTEYVDGRPENKGVFEPLYDEFNNLISQPMDGDRALDYVRILQPAGEPPNEWKRFSRQNEVVQGIYTAMLDPENILKLPSAIGDIYHLLVTDLKPKELRSLYCMLTESEVALRNEEITKEMIKLVPDGGGSIEPVDVEEIWDLIEELENWVPEDTE